MRIKRPFLLWLICLIFLGIAFVYLLQLIQTIESWNILLAVHYQPGPLYPLFQGVFFFIGFLAAAGLLWLQITWAPLFDTLLLSLAALWYWLDRLVFATNVQPVTNFLFAMVLFLILFILVIASLRTLQPYMRSVSAPSKEEENE